MSAHDADRLTDEDRRRITDAMDKLVSLWRINPSGYTPRWSDLTTVELVGVHAIGCSAADLRPVESEWVRSAGVAALGLKVEP